MEREAIIYVDDVLLRVTASEPTEIDGATPRRADDSVPTSEKAGKCTDPKKGHKDTDRRNQTPTKK